VGNGFCGHELADLAAWIAHEIVNATVIICCPGAANLPLYQLLGGTSHTSVMAYGVGRGTMCYEPAYADLPSEHAWSIPKYPNPTPKLFEAARVAAGPDIHLLHDVHHRRRGAGREVPVPARVSTGEPAAARRHALELVSVMARLHPGRLDTLPADGTARETRQVVGNLLDRLVAPENPGAVLGRIAHTDTRIVSLTLRGVDEAGAAHTVHDPLASTLAAERAKLQAAASMNERVTVFTTFTPVFGELGAEPRFAAAVARRLQ
jgi:hypothetical protein